MLWKDGSWLTLLSVAVLAICSTTAASTKNCPGYSAINVRQTSSSFKADLVLSGKPCNVYGNDISKLVLEVEYEDSESMVYVNFEPSID
jgi:alpha-glucosidase